MLGFTVLSHCFSSDDFESIRKLAEQGDSDAQFKLGCCYYYRQGVPKNYKEAVKWYRRSAEQGNGDAQLSLGISYFKGEGIARDYVLAYMWFNLSLAEDNKAEAKEILDALEPIMTREQIGKAQQLSREWLNNRKN